MNLLILLRLQYIGVAGTVQITNGNGVYVKFRGLETLLYLNSSILKKLNKFSVNEIIRIRSDATTVQQMGQEFKVC